MNETTLIAFAGLLLPERGAIMSNRIHELGNGASGRRNESDHNEHEP
jgi:hypothetical protein